MAEGIPQFHVLTGGNSEQERILSQLYEQLRDHEGKLVLVEERYIQERHLTIMPPDRNLLYILSVGKVVSPYLRPVPMPTAGQIRDLDTHVHFGDGDLEIVCERSVRLAGHWYPSEQTQYVLNEKSLQKLEIPGEALVRQKPFTRYFPYSPGCTQMIRGIDYTVEEFSVRLGDAVDAFFDVKKIFPRKDSSIESDQRKVFSLLKRKLG